MTVMLGTLAENVELEAVLASSYNDFVSARCNESGGRLRSVAVAGRVSPGPQASAGGRGKISSPRRRYAVHEATGRRQRLHLRGRPA